MTRYLLLIALLYAATASGQPIKQLDGKWAFTGLRTTVFKVIGERLFVGMIDYSDTANFNRFVHGLAPDSSVYTPATVTGDGDSITIHARFPAIDHDLRLIYTLSDSNNILFTGDVFFDSTIVIKPNKNCNLGKPGCINRLYSPADMNAIMKLKTADEFTRDDAFELLLRINENLKSKCNKCYAGFTDAYMNETLIQMGFNPIVKRTANRSEWYNTSGFTFFIKTKFSDDERVIKLTSFVFDQYLK